MSEQGGPLLTSAAADNDHLDEVLVINGSINVRKTHPNLYRMIMLFAVGSILLGANFWIFTPTFRVYDLPNPLWGSIFLAIGISEIFFLNFCRRLRAVRATMALSVAYLSIFGLGTLQPALEGKGSLQLPILYGGLVALHLPLLLEPIINPWTAKRDVHDASS